jgi:hypothetical protein
MHKRNTASQAFFLAAALTFGSVLLVGCAAVAESTAETSDESSDESQDAVVNGWGFFTSDEFPPVSCDGGSLVQSFECHGRYCDDVRLNCVPVAKPHVAVDSFQTRYFSDEDAGFVSCGLGAWMTGITCTGSYCDNISLRCTTMSGLAQNNCYWTGWISEEVGVLNFGLDYFADGAQCSGRYCDNMRFHVCHP